MTDTSRKVTLKQVPYIRYLVQFYRTNNEDEDKDVRALIDLGSEVNVMHPAYATKLGLHARKVDVGAQKINRSYLNTFLMVIVLNADNKIFVMHVAALAKPTAIPIYPSRQA